MSKLSLKVTPARIGQWLLAMLLCFGLLGCIGSNSSGVGSSGAITHDAAGNLYVADKTNSVIRKLTPAGVITTLAGTAGLSGIADGSGAAARFYSPTGITIDGTGNLYVADTYAIRKITPAGVVSTFAGKPGVSGSADGAASIARFNLLSSITINSAGNLFATDTGNYTIRKITPAGVVTTFAGMAGIYGTNNGAGAAARFSSPTHIVSDAKDNLYLSDAPFVRQISPAGVVTTPLLLNNQVSGAQSIMIDAADNIYVSNFGCIQKTTLGGKITTLAGTCEMHYGDTVDGTGSAASFGIPDSMTIDSAGNLFVADQLIISDPLPSITGHDPGFPYHYIKGNLKVRKIAPTGSVTTIANLLVQFANLVGVAADSTGNLFVADADNKSIFRIAPSTTITSFAAVPNGQLQDITIDPAGYLYAYSTHTNPDQSIDSGIIYKFAPSGSSTTLASFDVSTGISGGTVVQGTYPTGIAIDPQGNLFVSDDLQVFVQPQGTIQVTNSIIRKITSAGIVSVFAGAQNAGRGIQDGSGSAASFGFPNGIVSDAPGNLYVCDSVRIRKITPVGDVTTFAGNLTSTGSSDGIGSTAGFYGPTRLTIDPAGNLYVLDTAPASPYTQNSIRKITPAGVVSTILAPTTFALPDYAVAITFAAPNTLVITMPHSIFIMQLP